MHEIAERKFRELSALSPDPRKDKIESEIGAMVEIALKDLRPYGKPSSKQGFIEWKPEGLQYADRWLLTTSCSKSME
jgi:hypothetical protein